MSRQSKVSRILARGLRLNGTSLRFKRGWDDANRYSVSGEIGGTVQNLWSLNEADGHATDRKSLVSLGTHAYY